MSTNIECLHEAGDILREMMEVERDLNEKF